MLKKETSSIMAHLRAAILLACVYTVAGNTPVIDLGYAKYQGVVDTNLNLTSFRGIRYAAPPTGKLRWQAPALPSVVGGIQQADTDPVQCFQGNLGGAVTNPLATRDDDPLQSEDCLFLSVYSPILNPTVPLPTLVWIHGGGYVVGSASQYNGGDLVQESNNEIVVVVIQYRLGLFGFLAGEQIKEDGALNAGLLDQEFALRWIRKNIHKFGGDPHKVTIWGQSAGGGSVLQHVIAHDGKTSPPLFRAAMTSSSFLPAQYPYNGRIPQSSFNQVITQAGCTCAAALDCLRKIDSASLQDINLNVTAAGFQGTITFGPVVDGSFITQSPTTALAQGNLNGEILLSVTNLNEGFIFVNQTEDYDVAEYVHNLFPLLGVEEVNAAKSLYRSFGSPVAQVTAILGESVFTCSTYLLLNAFAGNLYKAQYAIPPSFHGSDVVNYFPSFAAFDEPIIFNNTGFINAFTQGFLSFAVNLDPNVKLRPSITPLWQKWSPAAETEMVFNKTERDAPHIAATTTSRALQSRCEFWKHVHNLTGH
ncbi:Alpha/Beta hydrolase protein [Mycena alexandri]|uniref:Carboxylic ester hydrolase n=1 Tax=Mycena alexandri TaxID=1745969 RepID=A0AAD6XBW3_9AGAR|nr:Alpha/Beta hydrolase protein [Mycena alexandri]